MVVGDVVVDGRTVGSCFLGASMLITTGLGLFCTFNLGFCRLGTCLKGLGPGKGFLGKGFSLGRTGLPMTELGFTIGLGRGADSESSSSSRISKAVEDEDGVDDDDEYTVGVVGALANGLAVLA